ncbi:MAG: hypothetical protein IAC42_07390 [Spirochaetes bacterium]|uniref:Fibronectin type-III domain-containing protein n=1 Tax=Candidatus Aphodenecus pullistercoris TaxID=2840669 RepID=A0A9D9HB67_9SPIR|nr:hypothetical protein [Candidatus Aphodenecus pullistercoris]
MRKYPAILLAVLLLLAACSAEIVDNLPARDVEKASEVASVSAGGDSLTVSFSPVAYAKGYGYKLSGGSYIQITSPEYVDGKITFTVTKVQDNIGDIYIYAESASDIPVEIAHSSYALSLKDVAPDVYISERGSDFVILRTSHEDRTSIIYKVDIDDESYIFPYVGVMKIYGLDPNQTYTVTVSHSLDGEDWSDKTTTVTIPIFGGTKTDIDFHIVDDVLTASGITSDSVTLYKKTEYTQEGDGKELMTVDVSDDSASIAASELKSLESGYFYFKSSDGVYSNVIKYTTPATVKSVTPNWRSAELEIDFADDFTAGDYTITVSGAGRNSAANVTEKGLKIDGLDSNTSYDDVTISFRKSDSLGSTSSSTAIKTQSFAGTYQWEGMFAGSNQLSNFKIVVKDAPEDSEMPYYVYFDTTAETGDLDIISANNGEYVGKELRIMPLVDYSAGESGATSSNPVTIRSPGELAKQNTAYLANSNKWNTSGMTPITWYIEPDQDDDAKDVVRTVTTSTAMLGIQVKTTTIFSFMEAKIDGVIVPVVKFKNTANKFQNFIKSNSEDQRAQYGDLTESEWRYCWYLQKVEEV